MHRKERTQGNLESGALLMIAIAFISGSYISIDALVTPPPNYVLLWNETFSGGVLTRH